jgi:Fe-Mn family superoxide dismutase
MELSKRKFLGLLAASASSLGLGGKVFAAGGTSASTGNRGKNAMPIELPPLPYAQNALEPHISANTLSFHHGKHHKAYVDNANKLLQGSELAGKSLEDIMKATAGDAAKGAIFNNVAQVWNHTFYWKSMKPAGGGEPKGELLQKLNADFGSLDKFKEEFKNAGATQFGSGWAWLVLDGGKLKAVKTPNADNPLVRNQIPLLTMDVWEHAYYLDYQNRRPDYIDTFLGKLVNWDFAAENLAKAKNKKAA